MGSHHGAGGKFWLLNTFLSKKYLPFGLESPPARGGLLVTCYLLFLLPFAGHALLARGYRVQSVVPGEHDGKWLFKGTPLRDPV